LAQNIVSLFILTFALFYFYRGIALKSFAFLWMVSGLLLWLIGRSSYHIGASGLIYALAFFLFFSGVFRRYIPLIAISAVIVFAYGSLVWGLFPFKDHPEVSWEGHLSGAAAGIFFSIIFRKYGPQKPVKIWEEEPDDDNPFWLEKENNADF
jgi:membrane associated rhomboid family serine protease